MKDKIDDILQQWKSIKPELDCSSMGVIGRLRQVDMSWKKKLDCVFNNQNMTGVEFDILATLRRSQVALTPTELYKMLMLSSGAMSTHIEKLAQRDLIERVSSQQDRRSCKIMLTEQGVVIIDIALQAHVKNMDNMLGALNDNEKTQFSELLKKVLLAE